MDRRKRTEILIKGSMDIVKRFAEEIEEKYSVKVIEEPNNGLVMIKMWEDARKSKFFLGEVLVTEAKVQIYNKLGIGIVNGDEPELSYYLAVVDAAYSANLQEVDLWENILLKEEERINEKIRKEYMSILKTQVNFDTMSV